jgi:hypothetical protein
MEKKITVSIGERVKPSKNFILILPPKFSERLQDILDCNHAHDDMITLISYVIDDMKKKGL